MRPAYRSRKVVLESMKPEQAKLKPEQSGNSRSSLNTPVMLPPTNIIRGSKLREASDPQTHTVSNFKDNVAPDSDDDNLLPIFRNKVAEGDV
jgi:hypothetical protein